MSAPAQGEEVGVVLETERDMVTGLEPNVTKEVREPVGVLVEFGVGDDLVAVGQADGGWSGRVAAWAPGYGGVSSWGRRA